MKAFSPAQTGEVDKVIGTSFHCSWAWPGHRVKVKMKVIIQCALKHRDIGGKNKAKITLLVTQLPLATMEGHFDPRHFIDKIKIPGDESCNNGPHTDLVMFICTALRNLRFSKGSNIAISKAPSSWIGSRQISKVITLFIGISDALNL